MIDGVKIIELTTHKDDRGFFREIFRFTEHFENTLVGQLSHSLVNEGVIKAWHGHVYQSQWNYVVSGQIKVALYDNRKTSVTYKETMEFVVADDMKPIAYFFPQGVMHGYKCMKGPMQIIYVTSGVYNIDDEIRISKSDLGIGYNWDK
ncbi:MAG: dTDP-4-dehydrorhamnose 3,5-epimerase family protein [Candidatus Scalindua sp.]|nr:dTDP-4-dehydrorhamnose 3,5-epimerase family protein [Candidatus Scalindua sp.]